MVIFWVLTVCGGVIRQYGNFFQNYNNFSKIVFSVCLNFSINFCKIFFGLCFPHHSYDAQQYKIKILYSIFLKYQL